MFIDVSSNINEKSPKIIAAPMLIPKLPAFGSMHITSTANAAPTKRYGIRLPKRHQVWSLATPIIGCTIMPIKGGNIQK